MTDLLLLSKMELRHIQENNELLHSGTVITHTEFPALQNSCQHLLSTDRSVSRNHVFKPITSLYSYLVIFFVQSHRFSWLLPSCEAVNSPVLDDFSTLFWRHFGAAPMSWQTIANQGHRRIMVLSSMVHSHEGPFIVDAFIYMCEYYQGHKPHIAMTHQTNQNLIPLLYNHGIRLIFNLKAKVRNVQFRNYLLIVPYHRLKSDIISGHQLLLLSTVKCDRLFVTLTKSQFNWWNLFLSHKL